MPDKPKWTEPIILVSIITIIGTIIGAVITAIVGPIVVPIIQDLLKQRPKEQVPPMSTSPKTTIVAGTLLIDKNKPAKDISVVLDGNISKTITDSEGEFVFANVIPDKPHYFEVYQNSELKYHKNIPVEAGKGLISLGTFTIGEVGAQPNPLQAPTMINNKHVLPVVQNESANKAHFANVSKQASYDVSLVERGEGIPIDELRNGSNPYRFTFSINASRQTVSQITSVTYYLHPTFDPSVVTKTSAADNFTLSFTGSARFDLRAKVYFKDGQIKDLIFPAANWNLGKQPTTIPMQDYILVRKWGSAGSTASHFHDPRDIAVDTSGNVYVADTGNNRVQKFDSDGKFITILGSAGSNDGQFISPRSIVLDSSDSLYVADTGNNRVQKFDTSYLKFITKWSVSGPTLQIRGPEGIAIDPSCKRVYVTDAGSNIVQAFDISDNVCSPIRVTGIHFSYPRGIAVDLSRNVYVADSGRNVILKFDSLGHIFRWGSSGVGAGQFNTPSDVAVDTSGNVYVADTGNNRVQKFDSDGKFITILGSAGSNDGQFYHPVGVAVDTSGNVYVADTGNNRIQVFAPSINIPSR